MSTISEEFDNILREIKPLGKFQRKWLCLVGVPYLFLFAFVLNYFFLLATPDHWCWVPGRSNTSLSIEEWKNLTIPKEIAKDGTERFSKCYAYNETFDPENPKYRRNDSNVIPCRFGWEYATNVYKETAVSRFDWVCENKNMATFAFQISFIGMVVGALVFGMISDYLGRKFVFILTSALIAVFGVASVFSTSEEMFFILWSFRAIGHPASFISVFLLTVEFLVPEHREVFFLIANGAWPVGMSLMALILWALDGDWFWSGIVTSIPFFYFLIFAVHLPESPRWLASLFRIQDAKNIITKIAVTNEAKVPVDLVERLKPTASSDSLRNSAITFLKLPKQILRLLIISIALGADIIIYYVIHLNLNNISENTYFDFIILSIVEIPGYFFGLYLMRFGRRFTVAACFLVNGIFCIAGGYVPLDISWPLVTVSMLVKFGLSATFCITSVHFPELFPTAVRSIALTIPNVLSRLCNMLSPYIASLGETHKAYPFIIMGILSFICVPAYIFLPETKGKSLPQTISEAQDLGKDQKFWGLNLKNNTESEDRIDSGIN